MEYILSFMRKVVRLVANLFRKVFDREPPSDPKRTLAAIVAAAETRRVEWPGEVKAIYPSVYTVSLSAPDWAFYGATQEMSQERFTRLLAEHIARRGGVAPNLRVVLKPSKVKIGPPRVEMLFQDEGKAGFSSASTLSWRRPGPSDGFGTHLGGAARVVSHVRTVETDPEGVEGTMFMGSSEQTSELAEEAPGVANDASAFDLDAGYDEGPSAGDLETERAGEPRYGNTGTEYGEEADAPDLADAEGEEAASEDEPATEDEPAYEDVCTHSREAEAPAPSSGDNEAFGGDESYGDAALGAGESPVGGTVEMRFATSHPYGGVRDLGGVEPTGARPVLVGDALGCVITVENHASIGVSRRGDMVPNIELPDNEAFRHVGDMHGVFDRDVKGGWVFTCLGRTGTAVERPGDRYRTLMHGESLELEHGDILVLPASNPISCGFRFLCQPEGVIED